MAGSIDSTIDSRNSSRAAHVSVAVHDLAIEATQEEGQWRLWLTIRTDIVALVTWQSVPLRNRILSRVTTCTGRLIRMFRQLQVFVAVALIGFGPPLGGQDRTAPTSPSVGSKTGKAQIVGVVVDSLNGGYLSGADVVVEGARATVHTDSFGKFRIDSLPPGTYQVGVYHALLDTLGITLATQPFHIGADSSSFVLFAVPSAATIIDGTCLVQPGAKSTSAVIGHVNDPETLQPVGQVEVSVAWDEIEVSKEFGIRRTSRLVRDTTNTSGAFKICGLPSSLRANLQARRGRAVTAEIPISLGNKPSELFARTLLLSLADS